MQAPPCTWPRTNTTNLLLIMLSLQAVVCLVHATYYPRIIRWALEPLQNMMLVLFRTHQGLHIFFYCTLCIHALEAVYALRLIRSAMRGHFGGSNAILWALQTSLIGFPSLVLLMRTLADAHKPAHAQQ